MSMRPDSVKSFFLQPKPVCLSLLGIVLLLSVPLPGSADQDVGLTPQEQAWLAEHPDIVLGAATDYPPMVIKRADDTHVGVLVDIFEQISRRLNTRVRLHIEDSWADIQEKAQTREIDGLAFGARDPGREAIYNSTDIVMPTYFSVFARSQHEYQLEKFSDLDGMRIGYKRAARPTRSLLEKLSSAILVPFDSHESMTQALLSREIEVIVAWMSYDHWRKDKLQGTIDNILLIEEYPIEMVSHIRKDWPELIPILNKVILALQKDELPRIINKWFGDWPQLYANKKVLLTPEEQAWLDKKHTVRVRVGNHPPWLINEPEPRGMAVDYLTRIGELFKITFKYIPDNDPWIEGFKDIAGEHLRFDLYPTASRTPKRLAYLAMSEPYLHSPWVIFAREDATDILGLEDLRDKKVAAERGYVMQQRLATTEPEIEQVIVGSERDALLSLSTGKADAYIGNLVVTSYILEIEGISNIKVAAPTPYGDHSQSMATRKEWAPLISIINKGLNTITEQERTAIRNKYLSVRFDHGITLADVLKWVSMVFVAASGVVLVFVFWNKQLVRKVKERTAELSNSEARFRATFEQAAVGIAHVSPEGRFLRLNQKFCDILGYSQEEMPERTFQNITHPDDLDKDLDQVRQLLDGKADSYTMEERYIRKDGSIVWVNLTAKILRNEDNSPSWFVAVIEDISERIRVQEEVRKSYEFLDHLTQTLPDAIFSVKLPERTVSWCTDTYGVLGYEPNECIGDTTEKFYPSPDDANAFGEWLDHAIKNGESLVETELRLRRKNGELFPAEVKLAFHSEDDRVVGVTALLRDISERKLAEQTFLEYQKRLKSLATQLTLAEEQERRRIAAGLHDDVSQALAISRMQLAAAIRAMGDAPQQKRLREVSGLLLQVTRDARQLIFELSSPTIQDHGLAAAISEWMKAKKRMAHGVQFSLVDKLGGQELDEEQRAILFRNARELLTNALKHSQAKHVTVLLESVDDATRVTVQDDGIGCDPEQLGSSLNAEGGFGLFSIQERMADLGGRLEIESASQQGCTAVMTLPRQVQTRGTA